METAQRMGEYLRYRSAISPHLSELAILVTARQRDQQVEWAIHAPLVAQNGIAQCAIEAIRRMPEAPLDDEQAVHDFCIELQQSKRVSDATYARAGAVRQARRGRPDGPSTASTRSRPWL